MKLSVLIPTIPRRVPLLNRLLTVLAPQLTPEVEIIIEMDAGAKSIGAKRNALLQKGTGAYLCFVDDDDLVTNDYVAELLVGIAKGVDVVSIRGVFMQNGRYMGVFIDQPGRAWCQRVIDGENTYLRGVQHLDAIKREIAQAVQFSDRSFGEDHLFSGTIEKLGLVKTWHSVPKNIYTYDFRLPKKV